MAPATARSSGGGVVLAKQPARPSEARVISIVRRSFRRSPRAAWPSASICSQWSFRRFERCPVPAAPAASGGGTNLVCGIPASASRLVNAGYPLTLTKRMLS